jgi:hypothetical protein
MNQPIIREYLKNLENSGYTWLFNSQVQQQLVDKYNVDYGMLSSIRAIPSKTKLKENISKKTFAGKDAAEQVYLLQEFFKYAKMAEQMFKVTQGSNFDTATFNDPFLVFRKEQQVLEARNTMISSLENGKVVSGVDALLKNSFIGYLGNKMGAVRDVLATVLKADQKGVREVIQSVLRPYVSLNEREFLKVAQKVVADLFDWSVQVDKNLNVEIQRLLLNDYSSTATVMSELIKDAQSNKKHQLHYNHVINIMSPMFSDKRGNTSPNNISLINRDNKVYDQNQIIYGFLELKDYLQSVGKLNVYKDLVKTAILQSGISNSPISFTSLIPYEDFVEQYNDTLSSLEKLSNVNLNDFHTLGVFQRNNWSNNDVVPHRTPTFYKDNITGKMVANTGFNFSDNPDLQAAIDSKSISKLYRVNTLARGANSDFIVYTWQEVPMGKNKEKMKKEGDYSYIKRGLFQKVYYNDNTAMTIEDSNGREQFIYKLVNAWGDSFRANEFYATPRPSQIDNGFEKVKFGTKKVVNGKVIREASAGETSDSVIVRLIDGSSLSLTPVAPIESVVTSGVVDANISKDFEALKNSYESEYIKIENINGVNQIVSTRYVPNRILKNYTKFYSRANIATGKGVASILYERYGERIVVEGYEDLNFMTEGDKNPILIELSTGASAFGGTKLSTIASDAKEYFESMASQGKVLRDIVETLPKINANVAVPVSETKQVSVRGKLYDMSVITKEFTKSFGLTPKEVRELLEKICK